MRNTSKPKTAAALHRIVVAPDELIEIDAAAKREGLARSAFVRRAALLASRRSAGAGASI
jgi:hypothetical protein